MQQTLLRTLTGIILTAAIASAQMQSSQIPDQPPATHHHKLLGAALFLGGVGVITLGALAVSRPCPVEARALGFPVSAGRCGSSWIENHKGAAGASIIGTGAALFAAGAWVSHKSDTPKRSLVATPKP